MPYCFFNPKKLMYLNQYEEPWYIFNGKVDSFIYKRWSFIFENDYPKSPMPDMQHYIKLNEFGKLDFTTVHKGFKIKSYVPKKLQENELPEEQPMTYYRQVFTGGTQFFYDEENRIVKYITEEAHRGENYHTSGKQFYYDTYNNIHIPSNDAEYEYNSAGQIMAQTNYSELSGDYLKSVFDYDQEGWIKENLGYGYFYDEDDSGQDNHNYHFDKGIQLTYRSKYNYNITNDDDFECICEITDFQDNETTQLIFCFNKLGHLKYKKDYSPSGKLRSIIYFDFVYDNLLNWTKLTVSSEYRQSGNLKINSIYEREIQYAKDFPI
jgi:hypothetical protein